MSTNLPTRERVASQMKLCEERIGYEFRSQALLQQSMTHSSCASSRLDSNERLEFLGDAILGMVICRYLYDQFPDRREGQLTQQKSSLVSRTTCARVARRLGASDLILVGRGLQEIPESIDAALVESLIAAIYVDGGIEAAEAFILRCFDEELKLCNSGEPENYKSTLQEETQRTRSIGPTYLIVDQRGPDHAREYCMAVEFEGRQYEPAWGWSKKEAEQKAAMNALLIINPDLLAVESD
ncbi:MAG: ribonuclease III [Fuerstiella sp.]|nr:ribonuclease III [Fuerstiella sp.]